MPTSSGKAIGLILLVALIVLCAFYMTPLILAPLGIVPGIFHALRLPGLSRDFIFGPFNLFRLTAFSFFSLALFVLWVVVIVWVYRDAERRGMNGVLWALLVFIGNLIGLLIYLIVRSDYSIAAGTAQKMETCPSCQKTSEASYAFCPHCGTRLQAVCPACEKRVEKEWSVCPHCGEKLAK